MSTNIITVSNEKGGVGKTFLAVQLALYAAQQFKLNTLVIDLDSQGNATTILSKNKDVLIATDVTSADLFKDCSIPAADDRHLVLLPAPASGDELQNIAQNHSEQMLLDFFNLVTAEAEKFDLVIIDTNPNADFRSACAIACSTHVLCPVQLYQESVDGIEGMITRILKANDKAKLFLIPSMVESNSYQLQNGQAIIEQLSQMLVPVIEHVVKLTDENKLSISTKEMFAAVKRRTSFAEAQGKGQPIQDVANSERGWREMKRVLFSICSTLNINRPDTSTSEQRTALHKLADTYPNEWATLLKQYWMSNARSDLPQIDNLTICNLAELKTTCSQPFSADFSYLI